MKPIVNTDLHRCPLASFHFHNFDSRSPFEQPTPALTSLTAHIPSEQDTFTGPAFAGLSCPKDGSSRHINAMQEEAERQRDIIRRIDWKHDRSDGIFGLTV